MGLLKIKDEARGAGDCVYTYTKGKAGANGGSPRNRTVDLRPCTSQQKKKNPATLTSKIHPDVHPGCPGQHPWNIPDVRENIQMYIQKIWDVRGNIRMYIQKNWDVRGASFLHPKKTSGCGCEVFLRGEEVPLTSILHPLGQFYLP